MAPSASLIKFKVTGTVQGVCFRYYTQREAERLGLRGWCHNHPDASVEGAAAGPADAIAKFKVFLSRGPPAARVTDVHVDETCDPSPGAVTAMLGEQDGFHVRRYRA
ncbi:hypothetical protein CspeluHIS016_0204750 [Cutaneotrichosporon spelunceum]|uniref:acylphosphatase n=1 Tax=Cutaneotrichosporon spelunceum TaxID=1672016 RepID=A0AAD3YB59_9TREE|nr:hypothetical protein CspeluHIS016_0204750 [Cutaneotrichosporon spelunceum]